MSELLQIQTFIQKIAEGITLASEIDTQVFDCYCNRLAGTVFQPLPPQGGVIRDVLRTGKPRICTAPGSDPACEYCVRKNNCPEKGFIHYPIIYNDQIVGVMGLICFDEKQAQKINDRKHRLSSFVEQMCEIIQIKLKECDAIAKEKEVFQETLLKNQLLNQTIEQISDGYIFINKDRTIRNYNSQALRILGVTSENVKQQTIDELIPDPAFLNLFTQNLHTVYERIYIHGKEYGIFVSFFYNGEEQIGCSINFKTIDNFGGRMESLTKVMTDNTVTLDDYLGTSKELLQIKRIAEKASAQPVNILIDGENGTGKEMLARAIHGSSARRKNPFVVVDCKAVSPASLDEELFGASELVNNTQLGTNTLGKLELAASGTVFLNNVNQMPLYSQFKLLSCIKNQYFQKKGSNRKIYIDVRFIAATNQAISPLSFHSSFLEELYYCLNGIPIHLPPLRERGEDIMLYANYMLQKYQKYFSSRTHSFDKKVAMYFSRYTWPGNLHELDNVIQYMLSIHTGKKRSILTVADLPANIRESFEHFDVPAKINQTINRDRASTLRQIENQTITELLAQYGNSTAGKKIVAQKLGISLATLYRRLRE